MAEWLNETLYPGWGQRFRVVEVLAHERSPFQEILVFESASHGRVLMLDGCIQITEADEFVYQEMIAHVPLIMHGGAQRVLIIGAGDGGVLRRVLQHRTVVQAVMVEIDEAVIRLSKQYLPKIGGESYNDRRATVIVGDGIEYVTNSQSESFDVIIIDSTDPAGVGEGLFTDQFYAGCARILQPGGLIVNQCGVPFMQPDELQVTSARRARHFPHVSAYVAAVPTYVGGMMALGLASKSARLETCPVSAVRSRAAEAGILGLTRYWTPEVHLASFALPPYIAAHLDTGASA